MWIYVIVYFTLSSVQPNFNTTINISSSRKFLDKQHAIWWYQVDITSGMIKKQESIDSFYIPKTKLKEEMKGGEWQCRRIHQRINGVTQGCYPFSDSVFQKPLIRNVVK